MFITLVVSIPVAKAATKSVSLPPNIEVGRDRLTLTIPYVSSDP